MISQLDLIEQVRLGDQRVSSSISAVPYSFYHALIRLIFLFQRCVLVKLLLSGYSNTGLLRRLFFASLGRNRIDLAHLLVECVPALEHHLSGF